jgi:hypothetical protein
VENIVRGGQLTDDAPLDVKNATWVLAEPGKAYAIYIDRGTQAELLLDLPAGAYKTEWISTKTGKVEKTEETNHAGGNVQLTSPNYEDDLALRIVASER